MKDLQATVQDHWMLKGCCRQPRERRSIRADSVSASLVIAGALLQCCMLQAEEPPICELDVAPKGGVLVLPVTFSGKKASFLLDTGASGCIADAATYESSLGNPIGHVTVHDAAGKALRVNLYRCPPLHVGDLRHKAGFPVACLPLNGLRENVAHDISGVLGIDFLRDRILQIDIDRGKLRFLREVPSDTGDSSPLYRFSSMLGLYSMMIGLPEIGAEFAAIDTGNGASSVSLEEKVFARMVKGGHITRIKERKARAASGGTTGRTGFLDRISIGKTVIREVTVDEGPNNTISLGLLARFLVTIDFPNKRIYLKPNKRINEADARDCSGLHFWKMDGDVVIKDVDPKSPAAEQGIRPKDRLVRIDGKDVEEYSLFQIRKLLSREGKQVRLILVRGGRIFDIVRVTLPLRDYGTYLPPPKPQKDAKPKQDAKPEQGAEPPFRPLPLP